MKIRTLAALIAALCLAAPAAATAATHHPVRRYVPRPHHRCRVHYRRERVRVDLTRRVRRHGHTVTIRVRRHGRVVRVRRIMCVRVKHTTTTAAPPTPTIRYATQVDPTFTQAPTNPLAVTYTYSASASETVDGGSTDLGATGQLPDGVLNFYSATTPGGAVGLVCSMNVGGSTTEGSCPVAYTATGTYAVTTEYIPNGATAVTQTDSETISPYSTTTSEQVTTAPWSNGLGDDITSTTTVTDQNGNVLPAGSAETTITLTQLTGQVFELSCVGGNSIVLPQVGDSLICNSTIQVQISSPNSATFSVVAQYAGGPGYTGSASQGAQVTTP